MKKWFARSVLSALGIVWLVFAWEIWLAFAAVFAVCFTLYWLFLTAGWLD